MALFDRSAADNLDVTDSIIRNGGVTTSYQYTLSVEPLNGAVNSDDLVLEIRQSAIVTALDYVNTDEGGDRLEIVFKAALSGASALSATYTWNSTTAVLCSDTSEVVAGEWIRQDADGQWFEIASINPDVSVSILNPDALTIPAGATASSKGGDIRRLQGNQHEPCTPGSILGDHEGAAEPQAEVGTGSVLDTALATPPGSPTITDRYIVAASGTGDWSGHDDDIAEWDGTAWIFETPTAGVSRFSESDDRLYVYDGAQWNESLYWPRKGVISVDATDANADFATITEALAVAVSGDTIEIGPGVYAEAAITLVEGVTLVGLASGGADTNRQPAVTISHSSGGAAGAAAVTCSAINCYMVGIRAWMIWSGSAGNVSALNITGSGRVVAIDCAFDVNGVGSTGGNGYGIHQNGGTGVSQFKGCNAEATGVPLDVGYGVYTPTPDSMEMINCLITGGDESACISNSGATWAINNCRLPDGLLVTAASVVYLDGANYIPSITDATNKVTPREILLSDLQEKTVLAADDLFSIQDSADSNKRKAVKASSLGAYPFSVITVDAAASGAAFTTIAAALAVANTGDVILVGPGTYNEAVLPTVAVTIQGTAGTTKTDTPSTTVRLATATSGLATFDPQITGVQVKDIHFVAEWQGSTGYITACRCGISFKAENCFFEQTTVGATGGAGYGFFQDGASGSDFYGCRFDATGAFAHYGVYADAFGYSRFFDCLFDGTDAAIYADHASMQFICYGGHVIGDIDLTNATTGNPIFVGTNITGGITDPSAVIHLRSVALDEVPQKTTPVDADRVLVYDTEDEPNHKAVQIGNLGVGTGLLGGAWSFSTTITDADPGSKNFRLNNATQASATFIYVSDTADSGVDASTILNNLSSGDRVYIQEAKDATRYHLCVLTGAPTDATGYVKLPITVESSGADLTNNKKCVFLFAFTGGGTANAVTATAVIADNAVVRGDGGARGVQDTGITVNDTDQIASIETATFNTVHDNGNLGATPTINFNLGQKQKGTISANITAITFTAPPGPGNFMLELTENGTGGYTVPASAWPATVITGNGDTPEFDTSANARNMFAVYYDGTNYWLSWGKQGWAHPT